MNIKEKAVSLMKKTGMVLKKASPELLIGGGIIGIVGAGVWACFATKKVDSVVEDHKIALEEVKESFKGVEDPKEYRKAIAGVYIHTGLDFARLYGPAVALGATSIGCIVASNGIQRKRNAALGAAYAAEFNSFKKYRDAVAEKYGPEIEKEIRYGIKNEKFEKTVTDEKTGKEKTVKESVKVSEGMCCDEHSVFFDEMNPNYVKNNDYNLDFLIRNQKLANATLRRDGFISENDIRGMLGAPKTKAGQFSGYTYDRNNPDDDRYRLPDGTIEKVDFGIFNINRVKSVDFVRGYESAILLNFKNLDPDFMNNAKWGGGEAFE